MVHCCFPTQHLTHNKCFIHLSLIKFISILGPIIIPVLGLMEWTLTQCQAQVTNLSLISLYLGATPVRENHHPPVTILQLSLSWLTFP